MSETKKQTWLDSLAVYKDIRMVRILLLGCNKWISMGINCKQLESLA